MKNTEIAFDYEAAEQFLRIIQESMDALEDAHSRATEMHNTVLRDITAEKTIDVLTYKGTAGDDICIFLEGLQGHIKTIYELIEVLNQYVAIYNQEMKAADTGAAMQMILETK